MRLFAYGLLILAAWLTIGYITGTLLAARLRRQQARPEGQLVDLDTYRSLPADVYLPPTPPEAG